MNKEIQQAILNTPSEYIGEYSDGYHSFNELYEFRKVYNAALFNEWYKLGIFNIHKSLRHSDGEECFGGGWFIVIAVTPYGQISNHYKLEDWHLFQVEEREKAFSYDGHTSHDSLETLKKVILNRQPLLSNSVRRSGETTREIDSIIQKLFVNKFYNFDSRDYINIHEKKDIINRVLNRLKLEHSGVSINIKKESSGIIKEISI